MQARRDSRTGLHSPMLIRRPFFLPAGWQTAYLHFRLLLQHTAVRGSIAVHMGWDFWFQVVIGVTILRNTLLLVFGQTENQEKDGRQKSQNMTPLIIGYRKERIPLNSQWHPLFLWWCWRESNPLPKSCGQILENPYSSTVIPVGTELPRRVGNDQVFAFTSEMILFKELY